MVYGVRVSTLSPESQAGAISHMAVSLEFILGRLKDAEGGKDSWDQSCPVDLSVMEILLWPIW